MVVEELIARIGLKATGRGEAEKFMKDLQKVRAELKKLQSESKTLRLNVLSRGSGVGGLARDFDAATRAARKYREEIARIGRVRGPGGGYGPGRYSGSSGRSVEDRLPRHRAPGPRAIAGGVVVGNIVSDAVHATARAVAKPLVTFANEETAAKSLKLTADVTDEQVAKDHESFRKQAADLGTTPQKMLEVANAFVAAGLKYEDAINATVPTMKTAKAGRAEVDDVAQAGIASINNLAIKSTELQKAYDVMLASGKAGQVELKDMAHVIPELAASGQKAGYSGIGGLTEITSQLQFARKSTSTASEAATNQKNFYDKVFADVTVKAFKKIGVDLEKQIKSGEKQGLTAAQVALNEVDKYSKGNMFKAKALFNDVQAGDFLTSYLKNKKEIADLNKEVTKTAPGGVDRDFAEMMGTLAGKAEQVGGAFERLAGQIGEAGSAFAKGAADIAKAGLEGLSGRQVTDAEHAARLNRINEKFGFPPGYKTIPADQFNERFGDGTTSGSVAAFSNQDLRARLIKAHGKKTLQAPFPTYSGGTSPTFGSLGDRTDWAKQGAQGATKSQTTNNNTTNSATVSVSASGIGLKEVADIIGEKVKVAVDAAIAKLGASVAKGNSTPTAPELVGP